MESGTCVAYKSCTILKAFISKMSEAVVAQVQFLEITSGSDKKQALSLLEVINDKQVKVICEILLNIRYGIIPLSDAEKKMLKRNKTLIMTLTTKGSTLKSRKLTVVKNKVIVWKILKIVLPKLKK